MPFVIGSHDACRVCLAYCRLERDCVTIQKFSFCNMNWGAVPPAVTDALGSEMLQGCRYALLKAVGLKTFCIGHAVLCDKIHVLAEGFLAASEAVVPDHVHHGGQGQPLARREHLFSHRVSHLTYKVFIEHGSGAYILGK